MTRRDGRHCTAPTAFARASARALPHRDWKAEACWTAAADKAKAAFAWYGSGLGVFSHFPLSKPL
jgi:hypothetical protein